MSEASGAVSGTAVALAHAGVDDLLGTDLTTETAEQVLCSYRELERLRNRLASAEHAFIAELERRGLPYELGATNTAALLRELLHVTGADAAARVRAASAAAPRIGLSGEVLQAPFAAVAAAQATGVLSPRHAKVVIDCVDALPDAVQAEHGQAIETDLLRYAEDFDPRGLATLAARIAAHHDPDGRLKDVDYRDKHRDLGLARRTDGSGRLAGELTAELAERLEVFFDVLAGPKPETDGVKDPRSAGQRRHDALLDALTTTQRAGLLTSADGVDTTVVLHLSDEAWRTGEGTARTGHGAIITAGEAIRWAGGDARVMAVAMNSMRKITAYGQRHRIFGKQQRLAIEARDIGCTFPGCDAPAPRCETHHVLDHARGGPTTTDNGALVCRHCHRERIRQGWQSTMINSRPAWIPPPWLDPDRTPRFNPAHEPWRRDVVPRHEPPQSAVVSTGAELSSTQ